MGFCLNNIKNHRNYEPGRYYLHHFIDFFDRFREFLSYSQSFKTKVCWIHHWLNYFDNCIQISHNSFNLFCRDKHLPDSLYQSSNMPYFIIFYYVRLSPIRPDVHSSKYMHLYNLINFLSYRLVSCLSLIIIVCRCLDPVT